MRVRAVLGIATLLVTGCKLNTDYFKDYRGVNLLSNYGFDATKPAPASGVQWGLESYADYSTGGATPVSGYSPADYMNWAEATDLSGVGDGSVSSLSVGPDGSSPAYRLEIKNLLKDGDFESWAGPDGWWTTSVGPTITLESAPVTPPPLNQVSSVSPISSKSLLFTATSTGTATLTLKSISVPTGWQRPGGYRLRFDYRYTSTNSTFDVNLPGFNQQTAESGGAWNVTGFPSPPVSTVYSLSRSFSLPSSAPPSSVSIDLGGNAAEEAMLDNVRLIQTDLPPYVTASFASLKSGSLQLVPGSKTGDYILTVWVHDDPTADQTGGSGIAHTLNRLYSSGITVEVKAAVKSGSGTYVSFVPRPSAGWPTWTQLTFSMGFDFVNSDGDLGGKNALQFEIAPTNTVDQTTGGRDAGSVLIAQPEFTFNP